MPRAARLFDIAFLAVLSMGSLAVAARIGITPTASDNGIAVIFAPWTSAQDSLQRATEPGGRFVRYGGAGFIAVVMPDAPDYAARMLNKGAWLVMDPQMLAACLGSISTANFSAMGART